MTDNTLIAVENVTKRFHQTGPITRKMQITALDGVSIGITKGETLGIAGESGCGKSTLGKIIAGLIPADEGAVMFQGHDITRLNHHQSKEFRRNTQMIFQDPFSSLNPRMRIADIIAEPMVIAGIGYAERQQQVESIMANVGLTPEMGCRFPDEFSGGQRQRIGIARALAARPSLLIADEPVSALDISIQAQIINLLQQMKIDFSLTLLMISHNLAVIRHLCDRVIVMYLGTIVENAPVTQLFSDCRHPYTEALLAAIPEMHNNKNKPPSLLTDDLPSPLAIPAGCRFHTRCRHAQPICSTRKPILRPVIDNHFAACHFSETIYP